MLMDLWNDRVKEKDIIYVLGDLTFKRTIPLDSYMKKLNGVKHLILGNHDTLPTQIYKRYFETVTQYHELRVDKYDMVLFHYPIFSWKGSSHGSWMLHGHSHNHPLPYEYTSRNVWNVGVDCNNYAPVSIEEVGLHIEAKKEARKSMGKDLIPAPV
jgi:calcineurin-like phosphoesterase family protein